MTELETLSYGEGLGWTEGKYFDRWSIEHFIAGAGIGIALEIVKFRYPIDVITATGIMIGWEVYECFVPPKEYWQNHIVDVLIGLAGFGLIKFLCYKF